MLRLLCWMKPCIHNHQQSSRQFKESRYVILTWCHQLCKSAKCYKCSFRMTTYLHKRQHNTQSARDTLLSTIRFYSSFLSTQFGLEKKRISMAASSIHHPKFLLGFVVACKFTYPEWLYLFTLYASSFSYIVTSLNHFSSLNFHSRWLKQNVTMLTMCALLNSACCGYAGDCGTPSCF